MVGVLALCSDHEQPRAWDFAQAGSTRGIKSPALMLAIHRRLIENRENALAAVHRGRLVAKASDAAAKRPEFDRGVISRIRNLPFRRVGLDQRTQEFPARLKRDSTLTVRRRRDNRVASTLRQRPGDGGRRLWRRPAWTFQRLCQQTRR